MQKRITWLLLMVSPIFVHAMESHSFARFSSALHASRESQRVQDLRKSKKDFEQQLDLFEAIRKDNPGRVPGILCEMVGDFKYPAESWYLHVLLDPYHGGLSGKTIKANTVLFLYYCYYQKYHGDYVSTRQECVEEQLVSSADLLDMCKIVQINEYSALGAAMIAKDVSIEDKRDFIQKLMHYGFKLTENDSALAELELYDIIPVEHKATIICLFLYGQGYFAILPHDVRKYIVYWMIGLFKEKVWVLPGKY